ncbi:hypothetical protein T10_965 [Trichinella papuae]|uniref:Uncharacterized protein n=1 Tax=Trichinella papuae TaxID=268474 RepID=A0A0V1N923_9BILA|nr:hypothetical protein T10_965 [Trichinella papuae]
MCYIIFGNCAFRPSPGTPNALACRAQQKILSKVWASIDCLAPYLARQQDLTVCWKNSKWRNTCYYIPFLSVKTDSCGGAGAWDTKSCGRCAEAAVSQTVHRITIGEDL